MNTILLNDNVRIPQLGFGVFLIDCDGSAYKAVRMALDAGYRHIDTAAAYFNEEEVGRAVRDSGIPREEIFVTSKLWLQDYGYENALKGLDASLSKLGLDYVDLYLLHQPYGDVSGAWKALEEGRRQGKIRSIGVSNMTPGLYRKLTADFETVPSVNQVECNLFCQQKALRSLLRETGTAVEAYQPLGHGSQALLTNGKVLELARKYGKSAAQILLHFLIQEGIIVLVKSVNEDRIRANADIFDFSFTAQEMEELRALDTGHGNHDPEAPGVGEMLLERYKIHD